MNDQQWDDYVKRAPHTLYGEMGRAADSAFAPRPVSVPTASPARQRPQAAAPAAAQVATPEVAVDPDARKRRAEDMIAGAVMLFVWGSIAYSGLAAGSVQWYWPVGGGFVLGWLTYRLLVGPMRFLLVASRWAIQLALYAALVIGILAAVTYLRNAS